MTLGMGGKSETTPEEIQTDKLIANQSLLLILILANHCTSDKGMHNPYREALFSFTNSQGKKTNEYLNSAEQITRNWNVDQLSVLITSWDII